jgi:hypothetical protein
MSATIFPQPGDHAFHEVSGQLDATCEQCKTLPRWPILKVGYVWLNPSTNSWEHAGWEFDTSAPGCYMWLYADIVAFGRQQAEIMRLAETTEAND